MSETRKNVIRAGLDPPSFGDLFTQNKAVFADKTKLLGLVVRVTVGLGAFAAFGVVDTVAELRRIDALFVYQSESVNIPNFFLTPK
jgi:hypothetical protein